MTPQEIQALIDAKIAGQGSAVDVGGALPQILSGILEMAQSGQKPELAIETSAEDSTVETVLSLLKINGKFATLEELLNIEVGTVVSSDGYGKMLVTSVNKATNNLAINFGCPSTSLGDYGYIFLDLAAPTEPNSYIILYDV